MDVKALSRLFGKVRHRVALEDGSTRWTHEHPIIQQRRVTAMGLTFWAIALAIVIGLRWGMSGLACYLPWLPFAFIILWVSTTALRFDEREVSEADAPERARHAIDELHHARAPEAHGSA